MDINQKLTEELEESVLLLHDSCGFTEKGSVLLSQS